MGLISSYDSFLAKLIRTIFLTKPEILSSSERNISFKDLVEIGSVEMARERIIEKEIETIMRNNHVDQINWLENKLGLKLKQNQDLWRSFVELCERRNLVTHSDGVVSSQYVSVCREQGVDVSQVKIGDKLDVSPDYYKKATRTVFEIGVKLVQIVWRKMLPGEIEEAARELNMVAYELLTRRRYRLASVILRFALMEMQKQGSEAIRKQMIVNYANAEKLQGNIEEAQKIIDKEDWSAANDSYKICIAAVKGDTKTVLTLMKSVVDSGLMQIADFRVWPVFVSLRAEAEFVRAFEGAFGEKLVADKEASTTPIGPGAGESDDSEFIVEDEDRLRSSGGREVIH